MATITINAVPYDSYADVATADEYLAADMLRADTWSALSADNKGRALVSATRLLVRQHWIAGAPPPYETPGEQVEAATSVLAHDIALTPKLGDSGSTASNVKAVGAGSARVEFFAPVAGQALPSAAYDLLRGLIGPVPEDDGGALDNAAYGSSNCQVSRFDATDYGMVGDGPWIVDPDERRL